MALLDDLSKAQWLLSDRGCDADWFRDALEAKAVQRWIPGRSSRNEAVRYDKRRYRRRSRIEIMFGGLKDWRRVAASPLATIDALRSSSLPSPSRPPSSSGYDQ
jgi:transposase